VLLLARLPKAGETAFGRPGLALSQLSRNAKLRGVGRSRPSRRRAAPKDGPPQCIAFLEMLGLGGAFVRLVDLPLALAPMSPLLPGLVIGGKLCPGSFEAPAAGGIRWS